MVIPLLPNTAQTRNVFFLWLYHFFLEKNVGWHIWESGWKRKSRLAATAITTTKIRWNKLISMIFAFIIGAAQKPPSPSTTTHLAQQHDCNPKQWKRKIRKENNKLDSGKRYVFRDVRGIHHIIRMENFKIKSYHANGNTHFRRNAPGRRPS